MEMPLVACSAAVFGLYASHLKTGSRRSFVASGLACGLAFSCKFSAIAFPPILALCGLLESLRRGDRLVASTLRAGSSLACIVVLMLAANLVITGFSTTTPSERRGAHPTLSGRPGGDFLGKIAETPLPSDWVGLAIQLRHQRSGGPSYLMGETRSKGWWYYYFVALAVKLPLAFWWLVAARAMMRRNSVDDRLILTSIAAFLTLAAIGSSRNYGVRYVLPLAPLAIVWISALAEGDRRHRAAAIAGILALIAAVATIHPHELSYFQELVGGPEGGRRVLADSNLDWGQGLRSLAQLQREHPEYRDLTLYYFGDTRPEFYGVSGRHHVINADRDHPDLPPTLVASTRYLAVSTSLLSGPWGPAGYFRGLAGVRPVETLRDGTMTLYRVADLAPPRPLAASP